MITAGLTRFRRTKWVAAIGLQVLEALKSLDDVGFVRYASVYRDFSHAEDFEKVISEINAKIGRDTLDS